MNMRKACFLSCVCLTCLISAGQESGTKKLVDSMRWISPGTIDCTSDIYWRIVAKGREAIPHLFKTLTDSTPTAARHPCKTTKLTVGDISYLALNEIASFPAAVVLKIQFDVIEYKNGMYCWSVHDFAFINRNKKYIQDHYQAWWAREATNYQLKDIDSSNDRYKDCRKKYNIRKLLYWSE